MNFFRLLFPCANIRVLRFLIVRPLLERGDLRITICQLRIDDGIYNVARVQTSIGCRLFIVLKFVKKILGCDAIEFSRTFRYSWTS